MSSSSTSRADRRHCHCHWLAVYSSSPVSAERFPLFAVTAKCRTGSSTAKYAEMHDKPVLLKGVPATCSLVCFVSDSAESTNVRVARGRELPYDRRGNTYTICRIETLSTDMKQGHPSKTADSKRSLSSLPSCLLDQNPNARGRLLLVFAISYRYSVGVR